MVMVNNLGTPVASGGFRAVMPQPEPSPIETPSSPVEQPQPAVLPQPPAPPVENPVTPDLPGDLPATVPDIPEEAPHPG
jgi:hypothetical protein